MPITVPFTINYTSSKTQLIASYSDKIQLEGFGYTSLVEDSQWSNRRGMGYELAIDLKHPVTVTIDKLTPIVFDNLNQTPSKSDRQVTKGIVKMIYRFNANNTNYVDTLNWLVTKSPELKTIYKNEKITELTTRIDNLIAERNRIIDLK